MSYQTTRLLAIFEHHLRAAAGLLAGVIPLNKDFFPRVSVLVFRPDSAWARNADAVALSLTKFPLTMKLSNTRIEPTCEVGST